MTPVDDDGRTDVQDDRHHPEESLLGTDGTWEPSEPRTRRLRGCLPVLLVLAVVGSGLWFGGNWAYDELSTRLADAPDYEGPGTGQVLFQVAEGATSAQIGRELKEEGVVASVDAFTAAAREDADSVNIQVGYYELQEKMPAADALAVLIDPANLVQSLVTVREGARVPQIVDEIADKTEIPRRQVTRALEAPGRIGLPDVARGNAEGWLYPATYSVPPGTTARDLLGQMVAKTVQVAEDLDIADRAQRLGLTAEEVITVASLLEYEANRAADYPKVARVIYNRLADDMPLQFDSTVTYITGRTGDVYTTAEEREIDSPYNTYRYPGLPAGPIGSPGEETIEAALKPADGDWLYFVPDFEDDTTRFSETYAEHQQWVEKLAAYCRQSDDC
ncbi:endolytic transglycosylase MltG [Nocardioides marmoraquaticus]